MTTEQPKLALELRFRPEDASSTWSKLFSSLLAWDKRLAPTHVEKTEHYHLDEPEPWTPEMPSELAVKCAGTERFSWMLFNENEDCAMTFFRGVVEVGVSIAMPRPTGSLPGLVKELVEALQGGPQPCLAMLFDLFSTADAEVMSEGLRGLKRVPPMLYVDAWAVERAGGKEHLLAAPCEVMEMPGGGLLLITRLSLWDPPTPAETERKQAVEQFLGLSAEHPLVFIEPATR